MTRQQRGVLAAALICGVLTIPIWAQQPEGTVPTAQVSGALPVPAVDTDRPSQPAVPTKEVPSPAAPSNMPESVAWGLGAAYVVEYLKKSGWFTFLSDSSTQRAKVVFGFLAAFITAAGIQFAVSGSVLDAGGASVTITGITFTGIKDVLFQWIAQQGWYDLVVHKRADSQAVAAA